MKLTYQVLFKRDGHILDVVVGVHPQPSIRVDRNGGRLYGASAGGKLVLPTRKAAVMTAD